MTIHNKRKLAPGLFGSTGAMYPLGLVVLLKELIHDYHFAFVHDLNVTLVRRFAEVALQNRLGPGDVGGNPVVLQRGGIEIKVDVAVDRDRR